MKPRFRAAIAASLLLGLALWLATRPGNPPEQPPEPVPVAEATAVPQPPPATVPQSGSTMAPDAPVPAPQPAPPGRPSTASRATDNLVPADPLIPASEPATLPPRRVSDANPEAAADFDSIALMFRNYRTLAGENPVGTNAEIMRSIMGGNPKGATLGPPEGQSLNENGELIDRWGSPYFFHQLSKNHIEIRSAGPDRRMWNEDDLIGD